MDLFVEAPFQPFHIHPENPDTRKYHGAFCLQKRGTHKETHAYINLLYIFICRYTFIYIYIRIIYLFKYVLRCIYICMYVYIHINIGKISIFSLQHRCIRCIFGLTCCQDDGQRPSIQSHATLTLFIAASYKAIWHGCSTKIFALGLM